MSFFRLKLYIGWVARSRVGKFIDWWPSPLVCRCVLLLGCPKYCIAWMFFLRCDWEYPLQDLIDVIGFCLCGWVCA